MSKDLKVSDKNWEKVMKIKMDQKLKSVDLVLEFLLNNYKLSTERREIK